MSEKENMNDLSNLTDLKELAEHWSGLCAKNEQANAKFVVSLQRCKQMFQNEHQKRLEIEKRSSILEQLAESLTSEVGKLRVSSQKSRETIDNMALANAALDSDLNNTKSSLSIREQKLKDQEKENAQLKADFANLQAALVVKDSQLFVLNDENEKFKTEKSSFEKWMELLKSENEALKIELERRRAELVVDQSPIDNVAKCDCEMQTELNTSVTIGLNTETQIEESPDKPVLPDVSVLSKEIEELKSQNESLSRDREALTKEKVDLEESLESLSIRVRNYLDTLPNVERSTMTDVQVDVIKCEHEHQLKTLRHDCETLQQHNEFVVKENRRLEDQNAALIAEKEALIELESSRSKLSLQNESPSAAKEHRQTKSAELNMNDVKKQSLFVYKKCLDDCGKFALQLREEREFFRAEQLKTDKRFKKMEKLYHITAGAFLNDQEESSAGTSTDIF